MPYTKKGAARRIKDSANASAALDQAALDTLQLGDVQTLVGLVRRYSEDHDYHYGGNEEGCVCSICSDARPLLARFPK